MPRVLFFAFLSAMGVLTAEALWPALKRRRVITLTLAFLSVAAWALPVALGSGLQGVVPVIGAPLKILGSAWLVTSFILMLASLPFFALRGASALVETARRRLQRDSPNIEDPVDPGRRSFLVRMGHGLPVAAALTGVGGVVGGELPFKVKRETVRLPALNPAHDGFKIGQITDVHVGAFVSPATVRRAVQMLDAEGVDLQVMTGDLIDDLDGLDECFEALGSCRAPHGMYAVYGNHEHWRGIGHFRRKFRQASDAGKPLKVLVDDSVRLQHGGAPIRLVGVDYPFAPFRERSTVMRESADLAFAGAQPGETIICLSHHPDFFPFASERGARLTLSGHTHGGQVAILGVPLMGLLFRRILGWYRESGNLLYVSGGTGHWMPFRVGIPTEVTVLTLRTA
jgi:predicted MPP superfamily phosphohydrolase